MSKVLIVHASRHGATTGIAERIAEVVRTADVEAVVAAAAELIDPEPYDACVIGAGVYMGSWLKEGTEYLERFAPTLAVLPVWLFSSGPLPIGGAESATSAADPIEAAFGPADGPGSGGRHRIEALVARIQPREHVVFDGAFDPDDAPKTMAERIVRIVPGARNILPTGDFRDWVAIDAWARSIVTALAEPVPA